MEIFITLLIVACAVIQIILIVKIWNMTDDVKRIKNVIEPSAIDTSTVLIAALTNQTDKCYNGIISNLYHQLYNTATEIKMLKVYEYAQDAQTLKKHEDAATKYIADAQHMCNAIGKELPPALTSLDAFRNFYNNFING